MELEELKKRIDDNANQIESNLHQIEENLAKINDNADRIQKNTLALDILRDYKKDKKILISLLITVFILWVITLILFHL